MIVVTASNNQGWVTVHVGLQTWQGKLEDMPEHIKKAYYGN